MRGLPSESLNVRSAIDTLCLRGYSQADENHYKAAIAEQSEDSVQLTTSFVNELAQSPSLAMATDDLLKTGIDLNRRRYLVNQPFTPGMQYSRRDAARLVGWPRRNASTIYGYKTDEKLGVCTIFVTLHKAEDVVASTAYQDALLDPSSMRWFSKSNRQLTSRDVRPIVEGRVALHVFVQRDGAEASDHYYLGSAKAHDAEQTTMPDDSGRPLQVVTMTLRFTEPIKQGLFDYFHPVTLD